MKVLGMARTSSGNLHVDRYFQLNELNDELGKSIVDFWCDNIRRFAENEPLLYIVDRNSEY